MNVAGRDSRRVRSELSTSAVFMDMKHDNAYIFRKAKYMDHVCAFQRFCGSPSLFSDYLDYQCASSGVNISLDED